MWQYEFSKEAEKSLERIPLKLRELITKKIKNIGDWLEGGSGLLVDIKKLQGEWQGLYRLRTGRTRVLFSIDEENDIVRIHDIGFRGSIYK